MHEEMQKLEANHKCVNATRNIGLFGMIDLGDGNGNLLAGYTKPTQPLLILVVSCGKKVFSPLSVGDM